MVLCAFSILLHVNYIQNFDRSLLGANNTVTSSELIGINSKMPRLLAWSKLNGDFVIKESIIIYVVNWPYKCLESFLPPGRKNSLLMIVMVFFLAVLIVGSFSYLLRVKHFLLSSEVRISWKVTFLKLKRCPFSHQNSHLMFVRPHIFVSLNKAKNKLNTGHNRLRDELKV